MASDDWSVDSSEHLGEDDGGFEEADPRETDVGSERLVALVGELDLAGVLSTAGECGWDNRCHFRVDSSAEESEAGKLVENEVYGQDNWLRWGFQVLHDNKAWKASLLTWNLREGDDAKFPSDIGGFGRLDAEHRSEDRGTLEGRTAVEEHQGILREQE